MAAPAVIFDSQMQDDVMPPPKQVLPPLNWKQDPSENIALLLLQRIVLAVRNTSSNSIRTFLRSLLASCISQPVLSRVLSMSHQQHKDNKIAYHLDPLAEHYENSKTRQNARRKASSDESMRSVIDQFLLHASTVAYHMRSIGESKKFTIPSLVCNLSPGLMFKEYVSTYSKFEHIGRSLYYNFWSLFFDDRERARSGLSAAQIELGTANFSLLISTAKKIGNRFSQYREACYALIPRIQACVGYSKHQFGTELQLCHPTHSALCRTCTLSNPMNASLVGLCEFSASHVDLPMPIKQFFYVIDHLFDIIRNICLENDLPIPPSAHIRSKSWNAGDFSKSMVKEVNEAVVQEHVEEEEEEDDEEEILVVVSPVTNESLLDSFQSPTVSASSFFLENMSKILAKIPDTFVQYLGHRARTVHQQVAFKSKLDCLPPDAGMIIIDYAQKKLPLRHRESQQDYFGKKGRPIFGCALFYHSSLRLCTDPQIFEQLHHWKVLEPSQTYIFLYLCTLLT
jgi:hypothetical protein